MAAYVQVCTGKNGFNSKSQTSTTRPKKVGERASQFDP